MSTPSPDADSRVTAARAAFVGDPIDPDVVEDLLAAYDERLRVNVALLEENTRLRARLRAHGGLDESAR